MSETELWRTAVSLLFPALAGAGLYIWKTSQRRLEEVEVRGRKDIEQTALNCEKGVERVIAKLDDMNIAAGLRQKNIADLCARLLVLESEKRQIDRRLTEVSRRLEALILSGKRLRYGLPHNGEENHDA